MLLSIIIPVYNAEKYLYKCIESIINQTINDIEVILVDDGSTDESGAICEEFSQKYNNIRTFHIKNGGPSNARNYGIKKANGKYIEFIDSDDELEKDSLTFVFNDTNMFSDLFILNAISINGKDENLIRGFNEGDYPIEFLLENVDITNKPWLFDYIWNKIYKRDVIINNGLEFDNNIRLGEDFLFNVEYMKKINRVSVNEKILYRYFIRNNTLSHGSAKENEFNRRRVIYEAWEEIYKQNNILKQCEEKLQNIEAIYAYRSIDGIALSMKKLSFSQSLDEILKFKKMGYTNLIKKYVKPNTNGMEKLYCSLLSKNFIRSYLLFRRFIFSVKNRNYSILED